MPKQKTITRARHDAAQGKAPSTQAGEFVREEIETIREGKHGARSTKQAIAIGLSKARRAGVKLPPPAAGKASATTRRKAQLDSKRGRSPTKPPSPRRSQAAVKALRKEGRSAASPEALARHARKAAKRRSSAERSRSSRQAASTRKKKAA